MADIAITPSNITVGMDVLRAMTSLKFIRVGGDERDRFSPAEFWKKYDASEFGKPAASSSK